MSQGHPAHSAFIPLHGTIVGGLLDGWAYAFTRFDTRRQTAKRPWDFDVIVQATQPGWPFPQAVRLRPMDYGRLQSIKGVRTPTVPVVLAVRQARTTENQPWLK